MHTMIEIITVYNVILQIFRYLKFYPPQLFHKVCLEQTPLLRQVYFAKESRLNVWFQYLHFFFWFFFFAIEVVGSCSILKNCYFSKTDKHLSIYSYLLINQDNHIMTRILFQNNYIIILRQIFTFHKLIVNFFFLLALVVSEAFGVL